MGLLFWDDRSKYLCVSYIIASNYGCSAAEIIICASSIPRDLQNTEIYRYACEAYPRSKPSLHLTVIVINVINRLML